MKLSTSVKAIAAAAILAASVSSAFSANITQDAGLIGETGETVLFSHLGLETFTDTLKFSIDAGNLDASATSIVLKSKRKTTWDVESLGGNLYNASGTNFGQIMGNGETFTFLSLSSGDYYFTFTGKSIGTSGGQYAVALAVTPVPEPESYAMMLAGLGVMGMIARRRKSKASA